MRVTDREYMELHLLWRSEIAPTEDIEIDETVFEEIYKEEIKRRKERGDNGDLVHACGEYTWKYAQMQEEKECTS